MIVVVVIRPTGPAVAVAGMYRYGMCGMMVATGNRRRQRRHHHAPTEGASSSSCQSCRRCARAPPPLPPLPPVLVVVVEMLDAMIYFFLSSVSSCVLWSLALCSMRPSTHDTSFLLLRVCSRDWLDSGQWRSGGEVAHGWTVVLLSFVRACAGSFEEVHSPGFFSTLGGQAGLALGGGASLHVCGYGAVHM